MGRKTSILLVDDDPRLIRFVRANLESAGYGVVVAVQAGTALELLDREMPDLAILDLMLPGMDGFELCRRIRQFSEIPIIMLTAKAEEADKVKGLRMGADDYLTKPFGVEELLARVDAVMRRAKNKEAAATPSSFTHEEFCIDFLRRRVVVRGREVSLTPTEYRLLLELARNAGRVMFHEELLSRVWGSEYTNEVAYLRAYVRHLRRKLEPDPARPEYILSRPGIGYMFATPS